MHFLLSAPVALTRAAPRHPRGPACEPVMAKSYSPRVPALARTSRHNMVTLSTQKNHPKSGPLGVIGPPPARAGAPVEPRDRVGRQPGVLDTEEGPPALPHDAPAPGRSAHGIILVGR